MTITRVGSSQQYADGWELAFGKGKKKASKKSVKKAATGKKKTATKKAGSKSAKKTVSAKKKASPKPKAKKAARASKKK